MFPGRRSPPLLPLAESSGNLPSREEEEEGREERREGGMETPPCVITRILTRSSGLKTATPMYLKVIQYWYKKAIASLFQNVSLSTS